ncbi:Flp family type IVb pilin [Salmonella enterica]|nr:Flp family type IVb pilin [Salmonella enterica]HAK7491910.1 Flp family type IVb pilin [Salmonella enterica]HBM1441611.1 Flp family type IVb pilin [Salmonella enterica subsp. enterica]HBM2148560.1 Flp family type IVb pilin [Salmonella enterica subsp. enterica]
MSENLMLKGYVTGRIIAESICNKCKKYIRTDDGVTAVEYAIVVAGVAAIVITIFGTGGPVEDVLNTTFTTLKSKITSAIGGSGGSPSP